MNEMMIFGTAEFGQVRATTIDGEPWFVGKDIAETLGYTNPSKALADHVDEEDKLNNESLLSLGQRGGWLINESGMYSLIFSSKLESARAFKRWVTSEVLPSIRKSGRYYSEAPAAMPMFSQQTLGKSEVDELLREAKDTTGMITSAQLAKMINSTHIGCVNRLIRQRSAEIVAKGDNIDEYFCKGAYYNSMNVLHRQYYITPKGLNYIYAKLSNSKKKAFNEHKGTIKNDIGTVHVSCHECANFIPISSKLHMG